MKKLLALAALCIASRLPAQAITLQPGDSIKIKAATAPSHVDTVVITKCYNASMKPITCPTVPPDTGTTPPSDSSSHEPAGQTLVSSRPFNALVEDGWTNEWYKPSQYTISTDATAPVSKNNVAQLKYPAGWTAGSAPADLYRNTTQPCSKLYTSLWFKYSLDYLGHSSEVNKLWFFVIGGKPAIVPEAFGSGAGRLRPVIIVQDVPGQGNYMNTLAPNDSISRGVWHRFETVTTPTTLEWWLDGRRQGFVSGKNFGGSTYSQVRLSPNYGGVGGTVAHDQYLWIDHAYVSCGTA